MAIHALTTWYTYTHKRVATLHLVVCRQAHHLASAAEMATEPTALLHWTRDGFVSSRRQSKYCETMDSVAVQKIAMCVAWVDDCGKSLKAPMPHTTAGTLQLSSQQEVPELEIKWQLLNGCRAANEDEGRQQFKDLKDQSIGLGYAPLWTSWATLEAKHGETLATGTRA